MEDPVRFDVYGKVSPDARSAASNALIASGAYESELAARVAANRSYVEGKHVLIAKGLTWGEAKRLAGSTGPFSEVKILQEFYSPEDNTNYCPEHELLYGGCLGCHVCRGFFVR